MKSRETRIGPIGGGNVGNKKFWENPETHLFTQCGGTVFEKKKNNKKNGLPASVIRASYANVGEDALLPAWFFLPAVALFRLFFTIFYRLFSPSFWVLMEHVGQSETENRTWIGFQTEFRWQVAKRVEENSESVGKVVKQEKSIYGNSIRVLVIIRNWVGIREFFSNAKSSCF